MSLTPERTGVAQGPLFPTGRLDAARGAHANGASARETARRPRHTTAAGAGNGRKTRKARGTGTSGNARNARGADARLTYARNYCSLGKEGVDATAHAPTPRPREHPHCGNARTRQVTDTSNDARAPERTPEHPMTDIRTATRARPPDAGRPRVVSVLSQKGGTGKTTLSCALAALASRAGRATAVLDLDPQASAAKWHDLRRANGEDDPPVFATPSSRMQALVDALGQDGTESSS